MDRDRSLVAKYGKTFGLFEGTLANLFTVDADLIRRIFIKDFDHFVNRRSFPSDIKYIRKFSTIIRDQEWREVRMASTPTFTTGKIKRMSPLIVDIADRLAEKTLKSADKDGKIDSKKIFSSFTMEVITKCAFGMTIDDLDSEDNVFLKNATALTQNKIGTSPLILLPFIFSGILAKLSSRMFVTKEFMYFIDTVVNVVEDRKKSQTKYNDFIEAGTEAILEVTKEVNGKKVQVFTLDEVEELIVAQSVLFLIAGNDTTANALTFGSYALATNPEVQKKLHEQVMAKLEEHGRICHEMINDFPYLDQFINEVLRMYPPAPRVERECNKDISYDGIHIKKGMIVSVPVFALHYCEEYYPEPEKFDPDRWAPENKANLNPYAFMTFGMGPRNCVGMRFALEEIKLALCSVVSRIEFVRVKETTDKLQFKDGFVGTQPANLFIGVIGRETPHME